MSLSTVKIATSIIGTSGIIVGSGVGIGYFYLRDNVDPEKIFIIAEVATGLTAFDGAEIDNENYNCQISPSSTTINAEACSIEQISIPDGNNKKYIFLSNLSTMTKTKATKTNLSTANNFFKIQVDKSFLNSVFSPEVINVDIKPKASDASTKYSTLKPLFGVYGDKFLGKTDLAVGKVGDLIKSDGTKNTTSAETISTSSTYICNFVSGSSEKTKNTCSIHDFSSSGTKNNLSEMNFTDNTSSASSSIQTGNYHLFKFTDSSHKNKNISTFIKSTSNVVDVTVTDNKTPSLKTIKVSELNPSVISGGSNKILFIFK